MNAENKQVLPEIKCFYEEKKIYINCEFIESVVNAIFEYKGRRELHAFLEFMQTTLLQLEDAYDEALEAIENKHDISKPEAKEVVVKETEISCEITIFLSKLYNELGLALLFGNEAAKSIECLNKSIEYNPSNLSAYYNIAEVYFATREFEKAIEYCDIITEKDAKHVGAIYFKGLVLSSSGKPEEAMVQFEKTLELDPESRGANYWLAECLLHANEYEKARLYFKKSYELSEKKHKESARGYAICELVAGDAHKSIELCDELLLQDPANEMMVMQIKGDALISIDKVEEGAALHAHLATIELDARDFVSNRALQIAKDHDREKARRYAAVVVSILPDMVESFEFLAKPLIEEMPGK